MYTELRYCLMSLQKTVPNEILRVHCATQPSDTVLRRVRYVAKSDLFSCPRGTTRLPLDGFSWNLILEYFPKTRPENWSFIKTWKSGGHFTWRPVFVNDSISQYLAKLFLGCEMFQIKAVEKIRTHILSSVTFFSENHGVYEILCKNVVEPETPEMTV
jgi:hypothetical protein